MFTIRKFYTLFAYWSTLCSLTVAMQLPMPIFDSVSFEMEVRQSWTQNSADMPVRDLFASADLSGISKKLDKARASVYVDMTVRVRRALESFNYFLRTKSR